MVAVIYPFTWQHTYIPVLPPAMIDIVCSPTPFLIGLLTSSLPLLRELPLEEVSPGMSWALPGGRRGEVPAQALPQSGVQGVWGSHGFVYAEGTPRAASGDPQ